MTGDQVVPAAQSSPI
uniref:Ubiquitin specific peptidase 1 n=3 Tax=Myomorpha TaxID=1963758 RepID=A0A8C6RMD1_NANGA